MIPRIIHYCWFGYNPKPKLAQKCFNSWKKYCPEYKIIEWNEDNYDLSTAPIYVQQAYKAKKWAFVTDYVRLDVVFNHGGIYLDTDVEIIRRFDELLQHTAFFGFEGTQYINTGLGFGAIKQAPILKEMMLAYENIPFSLGNGVFDLLPCPARNTEVLIHNGLICNGTEQTLATGIRILPAEYLCPLETATGILRKTHRTVSIHHFDASWQNAQEKKDHKKLARSRRQRVKINQLQNLPKKMIRKILGNETYEKIKKKIKKEER